MSRTPTYLAALASAAVSGLDPVAVCAADSARGDAYELAFVTDTQHRAWSLRAPRTQAAGAELDVVVALLGLLVRRVPFSVPVPRGFAAVPEGRAVVYPFLHGRSVVLDAVDPGPGVAAEIGRTIAALHNVERAVFDEAGVPTYEAESWRTRRLADLDRAAATGHVPTALLSRWEHALEDVSAWRFAPTPVHGDLRGHRLLVSFSDDADPTTASVRAVTGWDQARIGDPADDFAAVLDRCRPETVDSVMESYALARIERPDGHLRRRARLAGELRHLTRLLVAVSAGDPGLIGDQAARLRDLDERVVEGPSLDAAEPTLPVRPRPAQTSDGARAQPLVERSGVALPAETETQLLRAGDDAEATTVIPNEELERLRAAEAVAADDEFEAAYDRDLDELSPDDHDEETAAGANPAGDGEAAGVDGVDRAPGDTEEASFAETPPTDRTPFVPDPDPPAASDPAETESGPEKASPDRER